LNKSSRFTKWMLWPPHQPLSAGHVILAMATWLILLSALIYAQSRLAVQWHFDRVAKYSIALWHGYQMTLVIAMVVLLGSIILGLIFYSALQSSFVLFRVLYYGILQICRGSPLIVFLIFSYYIIAQSLGLHDRLMSGIVILSIYFATAIAEIIRGGMQDIPPTQYDVAKSFGLGSYKTFIYVIFPQLIQRILPSLTNQISIIIKDTSLLSIIGIAEFYQSSTNAANQTYASLEFYLVMAIGYLAITIPMSFLSQYLEKRTGDTATA
jgi:polar amino acid transport system permease protein